MNNNGVPVFLMRIFSKIKKGNFGNGPADVVSSIGYRPIEIREMTPWEKACYCLWEESLGAAYNFANNHPTNPNYKRIIELWKNNAQIYLNSMQNSFAERRQEMGTQFHPCAGWMVVEYPFCEKIIQRPASRMEADTATQ